MSDSLSKPCTAFAGGRVVASGPLIDVALAVKAVVAEDPTARVLTFSDATGHVIDLDLRGTTAEIVSRLAKPARRTEGPAGSPRQSSGEDVASRGRGRPKLGVVAREVTLLPRHWEWLALQRGGVSAALRRLVDEARRADGGQTRSRVAQEIAYRFMSAIAGNLPGFEEASRALFAGDQDRFVKHTAAWPTDVQAYAHRLAWGSTTGTDARRSDQ